MRFPLLLLCPARWHYSLKQQTVLHPVRRTSQAVDIAPKILGDEMKEHQNFAMVRDTLHLTSRGTRMCHSFQWHSHPWAAADSARTVTLSSSACSSQFSILLSAAPLPRFLFQDRCIRRCPSFTYARRSYAKWREVQSRSIEVASHATRAVMRYRSPSGGGFFVCVICFCKLFCLEQFFLSYRNYFQT